jgi:hypothetical protein
LNSDTLTYKMQISYGSVELEPRGFVLIVSGRGAVDGARGGIVTPRMLACAYYRDQYSRYSSSGLHYW